MSYIKLKSFLAAVLVTFPLAIDAKDLRLTVSNPTARQRTEVVEIKAAGLYGKLGIPFATPLIIRNPHGQQQTYQLTADSLLLLEAAVSPHSTMTYTVTPGKPMPMESFTEGHLYAWRVDDFTWENDRTAYRAYGPALQRTGEKAYGFDVWLKSVPGLVVADRYRNVREAHRQAKILRDGGHKAEADSLEKAFSLHLDHGNGMDCYSVGPSLGCGTPALMIGDSIVMPYCYDKVRIIDNGPLRFTAEFIYRPVNVDGQANIVEHRLISLDKSSYFNRMTLWYDGLRKPMNYCAGIVLHEQDTESVALYADRVLYADPADNKTQRNIQIYTGILFPDADVTTKVLPAKNIANGIAGHLIGQGTIQRNRPVYYFGAGWTGSGVRNMEMWELEAETFLRNLSHPLRVTY